MKIEPISAHAKRSGLKVPSDPARDVPTSTGATAAGRVRGREATSQSRSGLTACEALRPHGLRPPAARPGAFRSRALRPRAPRSGARPSRALRELAEVGLALFAVGVAALLRLLRHVEEEVGVV